MAKKRTNLSQISRFSAVGLINTAIDFGLLNLLNVGFGFSRILSNVISTTVAMTFSFLVNKHLVFRSAGKNYLRQSVLFLVVTAFGLYVLQNSIIYLLATVWTGPLELAHDVVKGLGLSQEFVFTNGAKAVATLASLVWNFVWYKKVVFQDVKGRSGRR